MTQSSVKIAQDSYLTPVKLAHTVSILIILVKVGKVVTKRELSFVMAMSDHPFAIKLLMLIMLMRLALLLKKEIKTTQR